MRRSSSAAISRAGPMPVETLDRIMELDAWRSAATPTGRCSRIPAKVWPTSGSPTSSGPASRLPGRACRRRSNSRSTGSAACSSATARRRSDEEMILRTTLDERLRDMLQGVEADVVVCGHTHMQFDRVIDGKRVVNAGSVGLPYGGSGRTLGRARTGRRAPANRRTTTRRLAARVAASDGRRQSRSRGVHSQPSESRRRRSSSSRTSPSSSGPSATLARSDHVRPQTGQAPPRRGVPRRAGDRARAVRPRRPALPARAREGAGRARDQPRLERHDVRAPLPHPAPRAVRPLPQGRRRRPPRLCP